MRGQNRRWVRYVPFGREIPHYANVSSRDCLRPFSPTEKSYACDRTQTESGALSRNGILQPRSSVHERSGVDIDHVLDHREGVFRVHRRLAPELAPIGLVVLRADRLRADGRIDGEIQEMPWGRFVSFDDPDGNGIVLQATAPRA